MRTVCLAAIPGGSIRGVPFRFCTIGLVAMMLTATGLIARAAAPVDRIELVATKYAFSSTEIRVRKGQAVVIALSSPDFPHGFSIPDLGVRVDGAPGTSVEVTIKPDRSGRFVFLCDNFCGDGHDRMTGVLVVTDD